MLRLVRLFFGAFYRTLRLRSANGPGRPTWSFGFEVVLRFLRRDWDETSSWPLQRLRAVNHARPLPQDMVKKTTVREEDLGGLRARWFVPPGAKDDRAILFFHGGSFIFGSAWSTHADVMARLALASGVTTIGVEYRLAPEDPFPAATDDALVAFDALVAKGLKPANIVVAGDSAGGNIALVLQLALRDRGEQAKAAILLSPWADLEMPGKSMQENDPYDFGDKATLATQARAYAGDTPLSDPRVSPIRARFEGLAPVLVSAGECELLRDDILALAKRMEEAGVKVTLDRAKDMPHNSAVFAQYHPSGESSLQAAAKMAKDALRAGADQ